MNTITLTTAVLLTLKSFASDTFSVFNITRAIREDVQDGEYEITGLGTTVFHDAVKETFLELLENVIGDIYETSDSGRGYREFRMVDKSTIQLPVLNTPITNLPSTTPQVYGRTPTPYPTPLKLSAEAERIIGTYIGNNGPVTMKQLQSRLKGHPYTCKDLAEYLDSIGLINKTTKTDNHSKIWTL